MKKTLIIMRGGIIFSIVFCGVFLLARKVLAGGVQGDVIDYTLLKKLQAEYAAPSEQYRRQPRISATTTEARSENYEVQSKEKEQQSKERKSLFQWLIDLMKEFWAEEDRK